MTPEWSESELAPGEIVGRLYRVVRILGAGAQGSVYEVEHIHLERRFALKMVDYAAGANPEMLARMLREAKIACSVEHPNVVRVVNFDETEDGRRFAVLELLSGSPLDVLLTEGPLHFAEAVRLAAEVAAGLGALHAHGVIHRDVKPANIFVVEAEGKRTAKVMDFGIARMTRDDDSLTKSGCLIGTPLYMAPEQIEACTEVDGRADIYSLGCTLYEMLTGAPPYLGRTLMDILVAHGSAPIPNPRVQRPFISIELAELVMRCLAKQPSERPASMFELEGELRGLSLPASPSPRLQDTALAVDWPPARPVPRKPTPQRPFAVPRVPPRPPASGGQSSLIIGLVAGLAAIGGGLYLITRPAPQPVVLEAPAFEPLPSLPPAPRELEPPPRPTPPVVMTPAAYDLEVSSEPSGAAVVIDEVIKGKTPVTVALAPDRTAQVRLEKKGFEPFSATITSKKGEKRELHAKLKMLPFAKLPLDAETRREWAALQAKRAKLAQDVAAAKKKLQLADAALLRAEASKSIDLVASAELARDAAKESADKVQDQLAELDRKISDLKESLVSKLE